MSTRRKRVTIILALLLCVYVHSYYVLSRQGFALADRYGFKGFFFFAPRPSATWLRAHTTCSYLYYPLIVIDKGLGTGRDPAICISWGQSSPEEIEASLPWLNSDAKNNTNRRSP